MANLGFIGLGAMGGEMVKRLLDAGHSVTGFNRTKSRANPPAARKDSAHTIADSDTKIPAKGMDDPAMMWNSLRQTGGELLRVLLLSPPKISISMYRRIDAPSQI